MVKAEPAAAAAQRGDGQLLDRVALRVADRPLGSRKYYVSSLHPYFRSCKYYDKVIVPKAQALRVVFDDPLACC